MEQRWTQTIADMVGDRDAARFRFRVRGESMVPTLRPGDQVVVEHTRLEMLRPGDVVLIRNGGQSLLHRFLGIRHQDGQRFLLTSGDRLRRMDPPYPEEALVGRAVAAFREDRSIRLPVGRSQAWRHRVRTALWTSGRWLQALLPLLLLSMLAAWANTGWAAVTLVSFEAKWGEGSVFVTWETASEVDTVGFYVWRSDQEAGPFQPSTDLIPSEGDIVGATYEWIDGDVIPGRVYYYKLEDLSAGGASALYGPVFTPVESTPTLTPTPTPTPSPTLTPTPSPSPTSTTTSTPTPSPSPTSTSTPTPTPSSSSTLMLTPTPSTTFTPAPTVSTPTPSPSSTLMLTPTPSTTPAPTRTVALASATSRPEPSSAPSPTVTAVTLIAKLPAEMQPIPRAEPVSEEELARAQRRLTWSLVAIGSAMMSGLLLIVLALMVFALSRWGFLRRA